MARVGLLAAALAVDGVAAKAGVLGGVSALIEQRCSSGHLQLRSLMSRLAVHEGDLSDVVAFLDEEVAAIEEIIIEDHNDAIAKVAQAVQDIQDADTTLISKYDTAVSKDETYQAGVQAEVDYVLTLEGLASEEPGLKKAMDDAQSARDDIKDINIIGTMAQFSCDMKTDENCGQALSDFEAAKDLMLQGLDSQRQTAESNYETKDGTYQAAITARTGHLVHMWQNNYAGKNNFNVNKGKRSSRSSAICEAGTAFVDKCAKVAEYRSIIAQVEEENSESSLSHPDRVNEWRVTQMARCVVRLLAEGSDEIDESALDECENDANFEDKYPFGSEEKKTQMFNQLIDASAGKFSCNEESLSFSGTDWEIAAATLASWQEYVNGWSPPTFTPADPMPAGRSATYQNVADFSLKVQYGNEDQPFADGFCED